MTENEAKYYLLEHKPIVGFKTHNEALDVAIQALEEIQQYRAIGTVEEFKAIKSDGFTDHLLNMGYTKGYRNGIDKFADKMIIMMPGHRQDIEQIVEQMKGGAK